MKFKLAALLASFLLAPSIAMAQSPCPSIAYGAVLTAAQWNNCFSAKQDALGFNPVNKAGDVMLGKLATTASSSSTTGFSIPPGAAPATPHDGDVWATTAGLFVQVDGATVGPLSGPGATSFTATAPLAVTFPGGVTNYALNFDSTLQASGGNLGVNLAHANVWTGQQQFTSPIIDSIEYSADYIKFMTTGSAPQGIKAGAGIFSNNWSVTAPTNGVYAQGGVAYGGTASGSTTVKAAATASGTLTLPAATDTLVGRATSDTLSNKTLASPVLSGTVSGAGTIPNSVLANSSITVSGATCTLGSSCAPPAGTIAVGTTTISGGTSGQYLYNNAGTLGSQQAYNFNTVVGSVSQSGGIPTGAIIESGSNANGSYIKFADGTMICWNRITVTDQSISGAYGSLFQGSRTLVFPVTFTSAPTVLNSEFRWGSQASWASSPSATSTTQTILTVLDTISRSSGTTTTISYVAIGRWF